MREMIALPGRIMDLMFWTPILFAVLLCLGMLVALVLGPWWWVVALLLIASAGVWVARRIRRSGGSPAGVILIGATGVYLGVLVLAILLHLASLGLAVISTVFWGTLLYGAVLLYVEGTRWVRVEQGRGGREMDLSKALPQRGMTPSFLSRILALLRRVPVRRRSNRQPLAPSARRP